MLAHKYKSQIAYRVETTPDRVFLYWKGRVALYAILKAMDIKQGDEVIIPAFTCVVVPNAIMYLGAIPVYVDISTDTYNMDISRLEQAITSKTKVIICQNTFGLSSSLEEINQIAKKYNLYTIEDCTHGFGGQYNGKPNGSYCDAAFYSTQWNKPFSTGIGGFSVINNSDLTIKINNLESLKHKTTFIDNITLAALILFREYFINRFTYYKFVQLYRFLSNKNLIIGSTQGNELTELRLPGNYFKDISTIQVFAGIKRLRKLDSLNNLRKFNAEHYISFLKVNKKKYVDEKFFGNHLFLKYPILVTNRELFISLAQKENVILGDWFHSPLYPVRGELTPWKFNLDSFPNANKTSGNIVNLPTDVKKINNVIRFLKTNLDLIM
ncbi:MAG: aminotransferase class I/II-fold pyridoxal phosphate-dependent enzyme [Ignavibacteriaceae bacterium]